MFQNQKKSPATLLKIKAPLSKKGGSKASSKKGSSEKSAKYREVLSLLSQNSASGKKQALPNLPKPGQISLSSGSGKENQIRQSRKQQVSSKNEANISLLSEATIPHEIREFNLTSIKKTKRFSYHGLKNNNFDQLQLLKIVQAMGDKESFALIPGQSFLTNSVLQSSGVVSSANFQEREIEEMRNLRFPGNMSQSRFIIADKFVRGGPRMMGILGQNRAFGGKPHLNKFLQVFNEKHRHCITQSETSLINYQGLRQALPSCPCHLGCATRISPLQSIRSIIFMCAVKCKGHLPGQNLQPKLSSVENANSSVPRVLHSMKRQIIYFNQVKHTLGIKRKFVCSKYPRPRVRSQQVSLILSSTCKIQILGQPPSQIRLGGRRGGISTWLPKEQAPERRARGGNLRALRGGLTVQPQVEGIVSYPISIAKSRSIPGHHKRGSSAVRLRLYLSLYFNQVSTASCVDTPEIEEESPLKETENEEPMSPQIEYNLIDQRQLQAQQREFDSIRENLRGDGGNILSFFVTSFMPIPDEKVSQKRKQDRFEVRTGYTSMALPYNSVIRKTPGQSIFGNF